MAYQAEKDQSARSLIRRHASNCIQLLQRDILTAQIAGVAQRADLEFAEQSGALDKELSAKQKRFTNAAKAILEKMNREPVATSRSRAKLSGRPPEPVHECAGGVIIIDDPVGRLRELERAAMEKRIDLDLGWGMCVCAVIVGILTTAFGLRSWRSFRPAGVSTCIQA